LGDVLRGATHHRLRTYTLPVSALGKDALQSASDSADDVGRYGVLDRCEGCPMHGHRHETSIPHGCRQIRCDAEGSISRTQRERRTASAHLIGSMDVSQAIDLFPRW